MVLKKVIKYVILVLSMIASGAYLRIQAVEIGKGMYNEGCGDAWSKLAKEGLPDEAALIKRFCEARKKNLDTYLKPFDP